MFNSKYMIDEKKLMFIEGVDQYYNDADGLDKQFEMFVKDIMENQELSTE